MSERNVERYGIYKRPKHTGEINSGEKVTDPGGYVDQNRRVMEFIVAGQRLKKSRKEMYDVQEGKEPDFTSMDPTRRPAYDLTDAGIDAAIVADRMREARKSAEDAARTIEDAGGVESNENAPEQPAQNNE